MFITYLACRLSAKNRNQPRNHTLDNRMWAIVTFYTHRADFCAFLRLSSTDLTLHYEKIHPENKGISPWNIVSNCGLYFAIFRDSATVVLTRCFKLLSF